MEFLIKNWYNSREFMLILKLKAKPLSYSVVRAIFWKAYTPYIKTSFSIADVRYTTFLSNGALSA